MTVSFQMKDCKKPCHSLEISLIGDKTELFNHTRLILYFKSVVTRSSEKYLYTWRNLFAEIGGYVGIFLGFSFLSLTDAILAIFKHLKLKETSNTRQETDVSQVF